MLTLIEAEKWPHTESGFWGGAEGLTAESEGVRIGGTRPEGLRWGGW